jgi:D-alanyl-lipoteichoic acid acyltransferase DltB (MBOAT superfamily)
MRTKQLWRGVRWGRVWEENPEEIFVLLKIFLAMNIVACYILRITSIHCMAIEKDHGRFQSVALGDCALNLRMEMYLTLNWYNIIREDKSDVTQE